MSGALPRGARRLHPALRMLGDDAERPRNLGGAIYGQVIATATTAGLAGDDQLGALELAFGVVATMVVFWLAHAYAETLAGLVADAHFPRPSDFASHLREEWPIVSAAGPVALPLLLAAVGLWSRETGETLALAGGTLALAAWGLLIARRSGAPWPLTFTLGTLSATLGLIIIGLEIALH